MIFRRTEPIGDKRAFIQGWLSNPRRTGAVFPSGAALSRLITSGIHPGDGAILELGPGTGAFTRALLNKGVAEGNLTLIEASPEFAVLLADRHPHARVHCTDATRLASLASRLPAHGAAVSGLPLLAMPPSSIMRILRGTFAVLDEEASMFQFTYGWRCPVPYRILKTLELKAERVGTVFRNFPPASVYRIWRAS